jgi:hypothetical protein
VGSIADDRETFWAAAELLNDDHNESEASE